MPNTLQAIASKKSVQAAALVLDVCSLLREIFLPLENEWIFYILLPLQAYLLSKSDVNASIPVDKTFSQWFWLVALFFVLFPYSLCYLPDPYHYQISPLLIALHVPVIKGTLSLLRFKKPQASDPAPE